MLAAIVFLAALGRVAGVAAEQFSSPYDLMYESPNLATIRLIRSGASPYDPAVYAGPRFTLTPYTPAYFYVLAALPEAEGRPFLIARIVSLASIACCAVVLAAHARRATARLLAIGVFLLAWPVTAYASYLRMDPPALALSALCLLALRRPTPRRVLLAAALAVLAVATKQTFVAAGVAGAVFLLARDRRLALRFVLAACGLGVALAGLATLAWGRGFWFSIFVLRSSPVRLETLWEQASLQLHAPVFVAVLLAAVVTVALAVRREGRSVFGRSPTAAYLLASFAVLLATLGKEGSSDVYFLEPALALTLWLSEAVPRLVIVPRVRAAGLAALLAVVGVEFATQDAHRALYGFPRNSTEQDGAYYDAVREGLRKAGHPEPRVLHLAPPRYAYGIADDVCMNDASTYDQAFEQGALDAAPLEAAIRDRIYDVVVVSSLATPERMAGRPTAGALEAVRASYRLLWSDAVCSYYGR